MANHTIYDFLEINVVCFNMEMHRPLSSAQHKSQVAFLYKTLSNSENPFFQSRLITFVESAILSWGTWDLSQYPLFCAFTFIHCFEYRARRSILSRNWIPPEEFNISILSLQTIKLLPSVQVVSIREVMYRETHVSSGTHSEWISSTCLQTTKIAFIIDAIYHY